MDYLRLLFLPFFVTNHMNSYLFYTLGVLQNNIQEIDTTGTHLKIGIFEDIEKGYCTEDINSILNNYFHA